MAPSPAGWLASPLLQCLSDRAKSCADDHLRYPPLERETRRVTSSASPTVSYASAIERTRRRSSDPTLVAWLHRLTDAAHDTDDLLDDIHYGRLVDARASLRRKLRRILHSSRSLYRSLICPDEPLKRLPSVLEISRRRLLELQSDSPPSSSSTQPPPRIVETGRPGTLAPSSRPTTLSLAATRELADLVESLVGFNGPGQLGNQSVPVVAIVGDGSIGKEPSPRRWASCQTVRPYD